MSVGKCVMIISLDDGLGHSVHEVVGLEPAAAATSSTSSADDVLDAIGRVSPAMVFFGVSDQNAQALALIERVATSYPETGVIVTAQGRSPELILSALRAGADEFLAVPCEPEAFREALQRVCRKKGILRVAHSGGPGRVLAAFSGKGGCGTTMIAANLAVYAAQLSRAPVAVADFDLQFGDMATMLDIQPRHTIAEVVGENGSLEEDLIYQVMIEHASGVAVMASPTDPAESEHITGTHIAGVLAKLKSKYSYVFLDTSCAFNECTLAALDAADDILLISDTLVPSIQATQRSLRVFDKLEYDRSKIHLVINRFDPRADVGEKELAKAFEVPVFAVLPNNFETAMAAIDAGLPIHDVAERGDLAKALRLLATQFVEGAQQEPGNRVGLIGRLLGRK